MSRIICTLVVLLSLTACGTKPVTASGHCSETGVVYASPCAGITLILKRDGVYPSGPDAYALADGIYQGMSGDTCRYEVKESKLVGAVCTYK